MRNQYAIHNFREKFKELEAAAKWRTVNNY